MKRFVTFQFILFAMILLGQRDLLASQEGIIEGSAYYQYFRTGEDFVFAGVSKSERSPSRMGLYDLKTFSLIENTRYGSNIPQQLDSKIIEVLSKGSNGFALFFSPEHKLVGQKTFDKDQDLDFKEGRRFLDLKVKQIVYSVVHGVCIKRNIPGIFFYDQQRDCIAFKAMDFQTFKKQVDLEYLKENYQSYNFVPDVTLKESRRDSVCTIL